MNEERAIAEIVKLTPQKDDLIVIKLPVAWTPKMLKDYHDMLRAKFPDFQFLIVSHNIDVSVTKQGEKS